MVTPRWLPGGGGTRTGGGKGIPGGVKDKGGSVSTLYSWDSENSLDQKEGLESRGDTVGQGDKAQCQA